MAIKLNLDKLDYQIIQEMMENAETSYADLGKKTLRFRGHHSRQDQETPGNGHRARNPAEC